MKTTPLILALVTLTACQQVAKDIGGAFEPSRRGYNPQAGANQASEDDKAAWRGAALSELETHPTFAFLPARAVRSDDGELRSVVFLQCSTTKADVKCWSHSSGQAWSTGRGSASYSGDTATSCWDEGSREFCCHHRFRVQGERVLGYEPAGAGCGGGASVRPR